MVRLKWTLTIDVVECPIQVGTVAIESKQKG